ncbi:MAG TPA: hypothetical protein VFV31_14615, partial [Chitinophagaceae bacterium]|nr:hypothetical protein [Chitinophagaceae bacterium]
MKKILFLLLFGASFAIVSRAQTVPAGMKYQAVARSTSGEVLPNRSITLKIELKGDPAKGAMVYYSEEHTVVTSQLGLFDLVIGMGKAGFGSMATVPWSGENIWMAVSMKDKDGGYMAFTESRLLAVPYAFHAATAGKIANAEGTEIVANAGNPGVPANVWSLQGNSNTNPLVDKLGTTDFKDLVFVTNNIERFKITAAGDISINNSLKVGVNVEVGNDLYVKKNVFLNTVSGATTNNGAFTVANTSPTSLTGTLTVNKATTILDELSVTKNTENFAAYINNTNEGQGDGLKIKLGKAKSIYSPPAIPELISSTQMQKIKDLIRCDFPGSRINLLGDIVINGALDDIKVIGSIAVGTGNLIIDKINATLGLPYKIGPYSTPPFHLLDRVTIFGGIDLGELGSVPRLQVGPYDIPSLPVLPEVTVMPRLPNIDLSGLGIPSIPITDLNFWGIPLDLCLNDQPGSTPLNNSNEFIRFTDKNDSKMGAIRAVSLTDWASNYLNPIFLYSLYGAITSSKVDKFHAQYHFKGELTKA